MMKNKLIFALSAVLALGFAACGGSDDDDDPPEVTDAGQQTADAGHQTADAGQTDAGQTDAGQTDAGQTDAGQTDAGQTDAGQTDAGQPDAGGAGGGADSLVISQIYIGGTGGDPAIASAYTKTYIELFNASDAVVDMKDYSLVYGGKSGAPSNVQNFGEQCAHVNCSIPVGGYYLIGINTASSLENAEELVPDVHLGWNNSIGEKGLYAIVKDCALTQQSTCADVLAAATDVVAASANECVEKKAPALTDRGAEAITRKGDGCVDTDDSSADFDILPANPRNLSSPVKVCQ